MTPLPQLPDWVFKLFFVFGALGIGVTMAGICVGVAWVIRHLHWSP